MTELIKFFREFESITFVYPTGGTFHAILEQKSGKTIEIIESDMPQETKVELEKLKLSMIEDGATYFIIEKSKGFLSVQITGFDEDYNLLFSQKNSIFTFLKKII